MKPQPNEEMLNLTESAKYLGISRRKFRRIAPGPERVSDDGLVGFWSRRVLDILPLVEDFDFEAVSEEGKKCGRYLIGEMDDQAIRDFQLDVRSARNGLLGMPAGTHTCGLDDEPLADLDPETLFERARELDGCDCPSVPTRDQASHLLAEQGVPRRFISDAEARIFLDGVLSALKQHLA